MVALSIEALFDAAIRIQVTEESFTLTFTRDSIRIKFPTTRRLAEYLDVPHYYILPFFASMEEENLVTRAERIGIMTTEKGTRLMIAQMMTKYRQETERVIGPVIFRELARQYGLVEE